MNPDIATPASADIDTDSGRVLVAVAWPTGRPIYAYTAEEITAGVDVYTRSVKAAAAEGSAADAR